MATFLLVHGGLHGGWCWETIVPLLEANGHAAIAPDLPGVNGEVAPAEVTLQAYADALLALARGAEEPVIAVAHSLGGRSVSLAAEQHPELFRALVYVTALVPEIAGMPPSFVPAEDNIIGSGFYPVAGGAAVMSSEASARAGFYSDCPEPATAAAFARLVPQPLGPMADPVELTAERWGSVPRHYVLTLNDMTIPLAGQRAMATAHPGAVLHELPSGHSPFITHPRQLADMLEAVALAV